VQSAILQMSVYVLSPDRQSVLLIHRDRPGDVHAGRYLGLGGHLEPGEDILAGAAREVLEESGLVVEAITLRGTILWTGFGAPPRDYLAFMFRVDAFTGTPLAGNEEGTLEWVPLADLADHPLWESDLEWLPMMFDDDPRPFHGFMPYDGDRMVSWSYHRR